MNISQSTASIHQNNQLDLQLGRDDHVDIDKICPGCKLTAVTDDGGVVVAFGQSFFHVNCFRCAKCQNKVTADTNLLLLSDGSPVCANCSYNCNVCKQPILDEAIMTGDDSYHAHCFKCKVCRNRIDELVFAKTSQGIYCMDSGGSGSSSSRDARMRRDIGPSSSGSHLQDTPGSSKSYYTSSSPASTPRTKDTPSSSRRRSGPYNSPSYLTPLFPLPPQQLSVNVAPPADVDPSTHPTLVHQSSSDNYRQNGTVDLSSDTLSANKTGREKRRSINPGLVLSSNSLKSPVSAPAVGSPTLSPLSATFLRQGNRSPTPPTITGRDSPRAPSPLRDNFPETSSRPLSNGSAGSGRDSPSEFAEQSSPRQRTISNMNRTPEDLLQPTPSSDSTPTRSGKLSSPAINVSAFPEGRDDDVSRGADALRPRRSFDERPLARQRISSIDRTRSSSASRAPSRADVPHSVESSTDTEDESSHQRSESNSSLPPAVPPKLERASLSAVQSPSDTLPPSTILSPTSDLEAKPLIGSDNEMESSPVEQTSHSTFIAPALPPIRFSMNTADFSDLLSSVGGIDALKSLDHLSNITERRETDGDVPPTPPPSANVRVTGTPSSDVTVFPSSISGDYGKDSEDSETNQDSSSVDTRSESSHTTLPESEHGGRITLTEPDSGIPSTIRPDNPDFVLLRLQEALTDARDRGAQQLKLDRGFVEAIVKSMNTRKGDLLELKGKFDGIKRTSKQYIDGLTVAQTEYDKELKARRDAEAEVTRLRVLLSGQAARLTALSGDSRKQELRQQMTKELHDKLSVLEKDLSKLTVDRDMALAEVEEISASKGNSSANGERPAALNRSLTMRLDTLKSQYQRDLVPLTQKREALNREISELKAVRDVFLEETTVLNARNEELAQLSTQYARRIDSLPENAAQKTELTARPSEDRIRGHALQMQSQASTPLPSQGVHPSTTSLTDDSEFKTPNPKFSKSEVELPTPSKGKFIKWPGSRAKEASSPAPADNRGKQSEHNFQQLSILRFTRCDHCGDKMWGSQLRCTGCNISVHVRCINHVQVYCSHQSSTRDESQPLPPSMFGRDLVEQVNYDARGGPRAVPVIVEKCIEAVEALALDYEGIYRKTGGSGQSKIITQLFERGDYNAFDLCDSDRFNDICSVTSVLKTYFRSLPVPLFTYDLHDHFMAAVEIRDVSMKNKTLTELVGKLPREHYHTVQALMMHLSRICQRSERNLMNARNLGVVFGPTLMRSRNPGAEFSDMAGKALSIEWLVENAPQVFSQR
ncbi:RhoGAP-domain-containing protein [Hymenopellis radicata]|nr:RhoGAP-domain-containing protein [Hymenopellis radicata]